MSVSVSLSASGSTDAATGSLDSSQPHPVIVEVVRGDLIESIHRGSALVLDADGTVVASVGEPNTVVFPRSAVKPIQAVGMLEAGLALGGEGLSIATGSHSGEPRHVDCVREMLSGRGLSFDALGCPPALPMNEAARNAVLADGGGPERAYMNCSGKHAAMLLTCLANDWPIESYLAVAHPLQVHLAHTLSEYAGEVLDPAAVDGCGAPLFGMTLAALGASMVRLLQASAQAHGPAREVCDAMRAHPFFVAGSGREDTELMAELPLLISKAGAEGVHVAGLPNAGAVVVKIDDGNERARMPVIVAGLRLLGLSGDSLDRWATGRVLGGGQPVGSVHATDGLFGGKSPASRRFS